MDDSANTKAASAAGPSVQHRRILWQVSPPMMMWFRRRRCRYSPSVHEAFRAELRLARLVKRRRALDEFVPRFALAYADLDHAGSA